MTTFQKIIKYSAFALAICLSVGIIGGIVGAVAIVGGFLEGGNVLEEVKGYEISNEIKSIDIKISAADFEIIEGDRFFVESDIKNLTVKEKNGTLVISEKRKFNITYKGAVLNLYVPKGVSFEKVEITSGAGAVNIDSLTTKSAEFEFGAGEVDIDYLEATSYADIEGGAGKISISNGSINNLDFDMGVGKLDFTSKLLGDSEFSLGVGETELTFVGSESDYSLKIEKGLGNIKVNGKNVSEYKSENGDSKIKIEGGVGEITVDFKAN